MVMTSLQHVLGWSTSPRDWQTHNMPGAAYRLDGRWIRDRQGRALLLRGFNLSSDSKTPPHLPLPHEHHLDRLAEWGMNCIRLVLVWEAVEPRRGVYDEQYLGAMAELARAAWSRGLHVVVDMHQDLFSRALGGSGAPTWAHPPARLSRMTGRYWFSGYLFNADVAWAFDRFWSNADFIRDSFVQAWCQVARHFADIDGVLGYDIFNEPAARFFPHLLTGHFDHDILPEFYQQVAGMVRAVDPHRLIFIEPSPLSALGIPSLRGKRINFEPLHQIPGLVYAPHLYEALAVIMRRFHGSSAVLRHTLNLHMRTAEHLHAGLIIGEFGVLNDMHGAHELYAAKLDLFDQYLINWLAWNYMVGDNNWNNEDISVVYPDGRERSQVDVLVRPYPRATAGTPLSVHFDQQDNSFVFTYLPALSLTAPTEIYLPRRHYPHGFDLQLSEGLTAEYDEECQFLLVSHASVAGQATVRVAARCE